MRAFARQRGVLLLVAAMSCSCASVVPPPAPSPPAPVIELSDGMVLSDADVAAVLEIGCQLGLNRVDRVIAEQGMGVPRGHAEVRLLQTELIEPTVLLRKTLIITRVSDALFALDDDIVQVGGWASSSDSLFEEGLRRVIVDDVAMDIQVTEDVAYDMAVRLVSAIVNGEVPTSFKLGGSERITSVGAVSWDEMPSGHDDPSQHAVYEVTTSLGGGGQVFLLCDEESGLVLIEKRAWIARGRTRPSTLAARR